MGSETLSHKMGPSEDVRNLSQGDCDAPIWLIVCCVWMCDDSHIRYLLGRSEFYLLLLDLNFIKKILIDKRFFFWETFDFWNLEVLKFLFQILRLWTWKLFLEIWNLKFEILSIKILKIRSWNFDHEIWGSNFWKLMIWV